MSSHLVRLFVSLAVLGAAPAFGSTLSLDSFRSQPRTVGTVTIAKGETISSLAEQTGRSVESLLSTNGIRSPRLVRFGTSLKLPITDGIVITLDKPTLVADLSSQYKVFASLITWANQVPEDTKLMQGAVFLPHVKLSYDERRKAVGQLFGWPTRGGVISSYFGKRNDPFTGLPSMHSGVDIAVPWGSPVYSAGPGVVIATGYNSILGNHIFVSQGQGYKVVYGHLSSILTSPGRSLFAGQLIGKVGSTGYSTGPHLHFTAYLNDRLLDPMTLFN